MYVLDSVDVVDPVRIAGRVNGAQVHSVHNVHLVHKSWCLLEFPGVHVCSNNKLDNALARLISYRFAVSRPEKERCARLA
jgi:hypothetical protein